MTITDLASTDEIVVSASENFENFSKIFSVRTFEHVLEAMPASNPQTIGRTIA